MENIQPVTQDIRIKMPDIRVPDIRSEDGRPVSEAEYWSRYYEDPDFSYEWNSGVLEEKPVSDYRNITVLEWFADILRRYLEVFPVGKMTNPEFGFRQALSGKISVRKPDLAVATDGNPVRLDPDDHSFRGIFDLCVELISDQTPKDIKRDTVDKKREYGAAGVREYYILDAGGIHTAFYRRDRAGKYRHIPPDKNGVIRSDVLPGFQFRISDLRRQPRLEDMADDEVYRDFVLLRYQAAKQGMEAERRRAEQAEKRAEKLAAKLRALGISPDE